VDENMKKALAYSAQRSQDEASDPHASRWQGLYSPWSAALSLP